MSSNRTVIQVKLPHGRRDLKDLEVDLRQPSQHSIGFTRSSLVLAAALFIQASVAFGTTPPVEPTADSFEGSAIYPVWTINQTQGTVGQSKEQAYSGAQSLKFQSTPGSQVNLLATRTFPAETKGTVSVTFYDSSPGQETLYSSLILLDSRNPQNSAGVGTQDFDAYCYTANVGGNQGPNANCGQYPQLTTTPVPRTVGWHTFAIHYDLTTVSIAIDGAVIFTGSANYTFDTVQLTVDGPGYRPAALFYFDSLTFTPLYLDYLSITPLGGSVKGHP